MRFTNLLANTFAIALLCAARSIYGQTTDANAISAADLTPAPFTINVHFTNALASPVRDLTIANVVVSPIPNTIASPVGSSSSIDSVKPLSGTAKGAQIALSGTQDAQLQGLKICFKNIAFIESSGSQQQFTNICGDVTIITAANVAAQKAALLQVLQAVPKTNSEQNIFASGFVTSASSGTQGGLDLALNSKDLGIPGMTAFLTTDKTSTAGGDPKNFEVGLKFHSAYLFHKADFKAMKEATDRYSTETDPKKLEADGKAIDNALASIQRGLMSAVIIDFTGDLEGGATDFNVANYVGDVDVAIQSRTKTLFGSKNGYYRFRVLPAGIEGGKNIQSSTSATTSTSTSSGAASEDFIARYKGGGAFCLFYDNPESLLPFKRIELNLGTVQRYLFFKETETLSAGATPILSKGARPWYEASLLLYLAESSSGRYGLNLTYKNGSLPPNFSVTKSFNFGFVYTSASGK